MEVNVDAWPTRYSLDFSKMDEVNYNWTTDNIDSTHATTTTESTQHYFLPWWQQAIFYTMFVFIFVVAAGGNIIVVWIVLAHKRMRTVTNYFLVNLAIADVMVSFFNVLFHFVLNLYQDWFFGLEYCKFAFFTASCTISVSVLTFMAIAID
ncbi:unnamed protein product, partial [Candidula unifasciata]